MRLIWGAPEPLPKRRKLEMVRFHNCTMMVVNGQVEVKTPKGTVFVYTPSMIVGHLLEGWAWDESTFCEVDDETLELFPRDYRQMRHVLEEAGEI